MVSLVDIGPLTEKVKIRGHEMEVHAITARDVFFFINNFEDFAKVMGAVKVKDFTPRQLLLKLAPETVGVLIATGLGKRDDLKERAAAETLGLPDQLKLVNAIFRVTFPEGVAPFVEELGMLTSTLNVTPPNGKDQDGGSQEHISGAVITDTAQLKRSDIARARSRR